MPTFGWSTPTPSPTCSGRHPSLACAWNFILDASSKNSPILHRTSERIASPAIVGPFDDSHINRRLPAFRSKHDRVYPTDCAPTPLAPYSSIYASRASYLTVLKQGLIKGDVSSIRMWMRATVAHRGWRRVFSVLREVLAAGSPGRGASILYHVPSICGLRVGLSSMDAQRLRKEGKLPKPALSGPLGS